MVKTKKQVKKTTSKSTSTKLNIYRKLGLIQAKVSQIFKNKFNKFQNYEYFTEYQALSILKPLLENQKLTLTFSDDPTQITTEKLEKEWIIKYLKKATITNSEEPEENLTFHLWALGQNIDIAKAKGSAETYAIKYFLTKFFLIPVVDNLDPDNRNILTKNKQLS
ncbi:ERF family protein [endosymbiont GvMRE of Glomus versiforme]|uniref:ERF family protein n=1 Tax=endosymbiont GvMRE of Glomus versiforme TaxID=2039283 RepID=UPI000EB813B1|nr:ERF family protein [endosymbiont GvMRE of Glomus versiforme]RHZ36222.1 Single-stranded DNA-binding protein [endosymbiont GvMRE of Glomus versiforme]